MRPQFKETALADLDEARAYYEHQEPSLGDYFLSRMEEEFVALVRTAGSHRCTDGFYYFVTKRFHHLICYQMEGKVPVIYAVLDGRRDPNHNQQKLRRF